MRENKKYYNDIKKLFPINGKKEKLYLSKIKEQISEYDDMSYKELEEQFGSPIEIVKSYYDTVDGAYLLKRINIKRIVKSVCIFALLITTIYFGYKMYVLNKAYNDFKSGIPTEYEEIIETDE